MDEEKEDKEDADKEEAIDDIRRKIRELDKLDEDFKLLREGWDEIEENEKKLAKEEEGKKPKPETEKKSQPKPKPSPKIETKPKPEEKPAEETEAKPEKPKEETKKPPAEAEPKPSPEIEEKKPEPAPKAEPESVMKAKEEKKSGLFGRFKSMFGTKNEGGKPQKKETKKPPEIKKPEPKPKEKPIKEKEKPEPKPPEPDKGKKPLPVETMTPEEIEKKLRGEPLTKKPKPPKPVETQPEKKPIEEESEIPELGKMSPEEVMNLLRRELEKEEKIEQEKEERVIREAQEVRLRHLKEKYPVSEVDKPPTPKKKLSKKEQLSEILKEMEHKAGGIQGSAIVTRDGLIVASRLPVDVNLNAFGGFTASFFGAAETAVYELKKVRIYDVYIESDEVKIIALEAGESAFLVTMVKLNANTGLVLMQMKKATVGIKKVMEQ